MPHNDGTAAERAYRLSIAPEADDVRVAMYEAMVLSVLYEADRELETSTIMKMVGETYRLEYVPRPLLQEALEALRNDALVEVQASKYGLTTTGESEIEERDAELRSLENTLATSLRRKYEEIGGTRFPSDQLRELSAVVTEFLVRAGEDLGGGAFSALTGDYTRSEDLELEGLIDQALRRTETAQVLDADLNRETLRDALMRLIEEDDPELKRAISQVAGVYTCVEVIGADPELASWTKDYLSSLTIFIDTNILFHILCTADGEDLLAYLEALASRGSEFVLLNLTEDEFQKALDHATYLYRESRGGKPTRSGFDNQILWSYFKDNNLQTWDEYIEELNDGLHKLIEALSVQSRSSSDWGFDRHALSAAGSDLVSGSIPAGRHRDSIEHDTVALSLVHSLRRDEAQKFEGPWFLSLDQKLREADLAVGRELGYPGRVGVMMPETLIDLTRPFLSAEAESHATEVVFRALKAKVLPRTNPWEIDQFLQFVVPGEIDAGAVRRLITEASLDRELKDALATGDYSAAVRKLLVALESGKFERVTERLEHVLEKEQRRDTRGLVERAPDMLEVLVAMRSGPQASILDLKRRFDAASELDEQLQVLQELRAVLQGSSHRIPGSAMFLEDLDSGLPAEIGDS